MALARRSGESSPMRIAILLAFTLACAGSSSAAPSDDSSGGEATGATTPAPEGLSAAVEATVTELFRLGNGARLMMGKAIQEECEECWPPEVEHLDEELAPTDLQPRALAETLEALVTKLDPVRDRAPFDALAEALEGQRDGLLERSQAFEAEQLLEASLTALGAIRAAIQTEAASAPTEPVLCAAAIRWGQAQMDVWELGIAGAMYRAERDGDETEGMRILGIVNLSRQHFEALSIGLRDGPETAVPTIREKLIFFRSWDSVFDRGDDEAVLTATADLCEPMATPAN